MGPLPSWAACHRFSFWQHHKLRLANASLSLYPPSKYLSTCLCTPTLGVAVANVWGQQGPRSPVLKPKVLNASCPQWDSMASTVCIECGVGGRLGPKPWARSQEASWGAFSRLDCGFPICERGAGRGTGWSPRSLPALRKGLPGGRLPGGGEQGGRGLGIGMGWRLALPSLVWATYLVSDLAENRVSNRARPSAPGRELTGSGGRWPPGCVRVLRPGPTSALQSGQRGCGQFPPTNPRRKSGAWSSPFCPLRIRRAGAYKAAGTA